MNFNKFILCLKIYFFTNSCSLFYQIKNTPTKCTSACVGFTCEWVTQSLSQRLTATSEDLLKSEACLQFISPKTEFIVSFHFISVAGVTQLSDNYLLLSSDVSFELGQTSIRCCTMKFSSATKAWTWSLNFALTSIISSAAVAEKLSPPRQMCSFNDCISRWLIEHDPIGC